MSQPATDDDTTRFCRYCKCRLSLSHFSTRSARKRRVCMAHMRSVYRMRHTVQCGGSIAVEHFRVLKNAYQVFSRDARLVFGGLKPQLRIQDLAPFVPPTGGWCMPVDPTCALGPTNLKVLADIEQRKTLLKLWESTRDPALYATTLRCFMPHA